MSLNPYTIAGWLQRHGHSPASLRTFFWLVAPLLLPFLGLIFSLAISYSVALILIVFGIYHDVGCYPTLHILFATGFSLAGVLLWRCWQWVRTIRRAMTSEPALDR